MGAFDTTSFEIKGRPLIATSERGGEWIATSLYSVEHLDERFEHRVVIISRLMDETTLLGQGVTLCYQPTEASSRVKARHFHGYCIEVRQVGRMESRGYVQYELILTAWSWFLSQRTNCRVFQQQKTGEIISTLCREHGFNADLTLKVSSDKQREYCVQYNESDWAFVSRLVVAQGWFLFFKQEDGKHQLIIGETNHIFKDCGESDIEYFVGSSKLQRAITLWEHQYRMGSGSVVTGDYNVKLAQPLLADEVKSTHLFSRRKTLQHYFYPGGFQSRDEGAQVSEHSLTSIDAKTSEVRGESTLIGFSAGSSFTLSQHPDTKEQQQYLLSKVEHRMNTAEDGRSLEYENRFWCLPLSIDWKSQHQFIKPAMPGLQSATVTGPDNEEVHLDQYHRIKLQFHWDRDGKNDQNSSCWVRVAQPMAGDGFGCQFTPRVGDEVLVSFLNDDPDQPLVVGAVYNGQRKQPYDAGNEQGVKLKSFPHGGADNYSELRFNCKKGEEVLLLQAEKDMSSLIKNDCDQTIKGNRSELVEKTSHRTVKEDDYHTVEGMQKTQVSKTIEIKTDANYQLSTVGDVQQKTDGNCSVTVKGSTEVKSTGDVDLSSSSNLFAKATNNLEMSAANIKGSGKSEVEFVVGGSKVSLSNSSVEITCGPSNIKLSPSGVDISGMQVKVEGQVMAEVKGGVSATLEGTVNTDVKGTMVTVNGNAMTSIKAGALVELSGAIAKIN
ncbi:hypothetical protein ACH42_10265 [Endozoicomonas sp. (ex Bugula neritina AB1)]|nr:hypothetical protein ACH42_10265 [Endozoicomonas sp. (ex Bugula neritina AB1)]